MLKGAYREREAAQSNLHAENKPQWSQVVRRGTQQHPHPTSAATTSAAQKHQINSGGTANGKSRRHRPARRRKEGVPICGARRIWRTHDSTTTRVVRKAIANLTSVSVDDLKIKRKYKTAENVSSSTAPKRIIRWWFVVRANESILQQLDGEWHKVALQTDWELTPLLQYFNPQSQSNPSQDDGTPQNSTNDPESLSIVPDPPSTNECATQDEHTTNRISVSPQQQTSSQSTVPTTPKQSQHLRSGHLPAGSSRADEYQPETSPDNSHFLERQTPH